MDGGHPRLGHPSGHEATDAAVRRSGTTKAARGTGVGNAASDAKGVDISFCDTYSDINASDDTDNNAKRPGQPHIHTTNDNDN